MARGRNVVDMTKGSMVPQIVAFAFPLLIGQLFQQFYNTFDTWCVGNFVGKNSFSAVGTIGNIINTLIGFAGGFSTGAGVVISHFFGAKDEKNVAKATHTALAFILILSVALTILGQLLIPTLLVMVNAPLEVRAEQEIYLRIYFSGIIGLLIYNMGSAVFRAVGNSTLPFVFLAISAVLNIIGDMVLVIYFRMGTAGVAYATVFAQGVSAILTLVALAYSKSWIRFKPRLLAIDWTILKRIIYIGLPSALQMAITSFSNIFVQSYINHFGADVMAGWTAFHKMDQLLFLPMQCLGLSAMTFVGQNMGSRQLDRARKGAVMTFFIAFGMTALMLVPIVILAPGIVRFFIGDAETEVIMYGQLFLRVITPFYLVCTCNQVFGSALRGAGKSQFPMYIILFSFVFARQVYLFIVSRFISYTILPIAMGYPFGWILASVIISIVFYLQFKKGGVIEKELALSENDRGAL